MRYEAEDDGIMSDRQLMGMYLRASREGRLHPGIAAALRLGTGSHQCKLCGMTAHTETAALNCCTRPDRLPGLAPGGMRSDHAALIVDPRQMADAVAGMRAITRKTWKDLFGRNHDRVRNTITRAESGEIRYIPSETWDAMAAVFSGRVPGCVEIARGHTRRGVA